MDFLILWGFFGAIVFILSVRSFALHGIKPPIWYRMTTLAVAGPVVWCVILFAVSRRILRISGA